MGIWQEISDRIKDRKITAAVIGLGYVGLPLSYSMFSKNLHVIGLDIDSEKVSLLNNGKSYIGGVPDSAVLEAIQRKKFLPTSDFSEIEEADFIIICVPTPLDHDNKPDLSYVENTAREVARYLRKGQIVVLESTTYPGTMRDVVLPLLEKESGLKHEEDFQISYSPEREDPGNVAYRTSSIPKLVGAANEDALLLSCEFYKIFIDNVISVSSMEVAEAAKITENTFRAVNIAFVNELKVIFDRMGIDVWEVIEAAATKPFGYMPFYPGPGIGGHCIPVDPFYLSWKAEQYGKKTRFIELAAEINLSMCDFIIEKMEQASAGKSLSEASVLLIGIAYKKNVADMRESPALPLFRELDKRCRQVDYYDSFVPQLPATRAYPDLAGRKSVTLSANLLKSYDYIVIVTDHDGMDYQAISECGKLVFDTRNALRSRGIADLSRTVLA